MLAAMNEVPVQFGVIDRSRGVRLLSFLNQKGWIMERSNPLKIEHSNEGLARC